MGNAASALGYGLSDFTTGIGSIPGTTQDTGAPLAQQVAHLQQIVDTLLQRQAILEAQVAALQTQQQTPLGQQSHAMSASGFGASAALGSMPLGLAGAAMGGVSFASAKRKAESVIEYGGKKAGGLPQEGTDGNWKCSACGNVNWERREACNRCGTPKG